MLRVAGQSGTEIVPRGLRRKAADESSDPDLAVLREGTHPFLEDPLLILTRCQGARERMARSRDLTEDAYRAVFTCGLER
ncbi:MAG: hypothetical protein ACE5GW_01160 [Planctomycetota bacterium]